MPQTTLVPDGDVTTQWDTVEPVSPGTHYTTIDEGISAADDGDYIQTGTNNDQDEFTLEDTPSNTSQVQDIYVNIRGQIDDALSTAYIRLELFHSGGTPVTGNPQDVTGADFGGYGVLGTCQKSWTGITLSKTQADSLQLRATYKTS